nr:unnamed protein product [Callosobruchus analis]
MEELSLKFSQLSFASKKIEELEKRIEVSPFGLLENQDNIHKWKYYTGFEYHFVHGVIFLPIADYITTTFTTKLSSFNQVLLTLIKLRLGLHFKELAYRFSISPTTASTYFANIVDIMYQRFAALIVWPDASISQKIIPLCFKETFHDKTTVILDCFEIFIEKPTLFVTQQQSWSNYKHHHTIKFLIGITPQGTINYIRKAWGGRTSDKQMVESSNFCNKVKPSDIVIADRGFPVQEMCCIYQVKLITPAFTRGKHQLHPLEIEKTRNIPHVRIHVERIIGDIKNKFNILSATIPMSMLNKGNDSGSLNILDKIVILAPLWTFLGVILSRTLVLTQFIGSYYTQTL